MKRTNGGLITAGLFCHGGSALPRLAVRVPAAGRQWDHGPGVGWNKGQAPDIAQTRAAMHALGIQKELGGSSGAPPEVETELEPELVDLVRAAALACSCGLLAGIGTVAIAVAEGERRLDLELMLETVAALFPALLVLELFLVQSGRLLDPVRVAELDGQLRGGATHLVPGRAERELIGDGADAAGVDVAQIGRASCREVVAVSVRGVHVEDKV